MTERQSAVSPVERVLSIAPYPSIAARAFPSRGSRRNYHEPTEVFTAFLIKYFLSPMLLRRAVA